MFLPKIVLKDMDLSLIPPTCWIRSLGPNYFPEIIKDAQSESDIGNLYMRMFYIYGAYGQDSDALLMQSKALEFKRCFRIHAPTKPQLKLLSLVTAGDMTDNTPLDFIVDKTNIQLDLLYVDDLQTSLLEVPDHDIAFVGFGESTKNNPILEYFDLVLKNWPRPYINHPLNVKKCGRVELYKLLNKTEGIIVAKTQNLLRNNIYYEGEKFVIRPVGSHSGKGFELITSQLKLETYLKQYSNDENFYTSEYINYRSSDGYFRKYRIVLISGQPFICHLAISDDWIVHYIAAKMEMSESKRMEEKAEMLEFNQRFGLRHKKAFDHIYNSLGLDYVVLDCSETIDNQLIIFEADPGSWIHATDSAELFPYKAPVMQKAFDAFQNMLESKIEKFYQ